MNQSFKITLKEYKAYTVINKKTLASFNIYLLTGIVGLAVYNIGYFWEHSYVPAIQRGNF
jgi:hypothetical protein